jgi:hypothetical protein
MKTKLLFLSFLLLPLLAAQPADVGIQFDDIDNPAGSVKEYHLIRTSGSTNRVTLAIVMFSGAQTNIQTTVPLPVGMNTLVATAIATNGLTSADSEPLTVVVPARPTKLRVPAVITTP